MARTPREPRRHRPDGTGNTHPVEALAHAAIDTGRRVAWFTLESLTAAVGRAGADGSVARTITKITRADLIMIDDIGMLPAGQAAAEALYRVVDAAYERRRPLRRGSRSAQRLSPEARRKPMAIRSA